MNIYQKSYIDGLKEQRDLMNAGAWLQGRYTLMAVANALNGKKCKYPKKPVDLGGYEQGQIEETEENYLKVMKSTIGKMNGGFRQGV